MVVTREQKKERCEENKHITYRKAEDPTKVLIGVKSDLCFHCVGQGLARLDAPS